MYFISLIKKTKSHDFVRFSRAALQKVGRWDDTYALYHTLAPSPPRHLASALVVFHGAAASQPLHGAAAGHFTERQPATSQSGGQPGGDGSGVSLQPGGAGTNRLGSL